MCLVCANTKVFDITLAKTLRQQPVLHEYVTAVEISSQISFRRLPAFTASEVYYARDLGNMSNFPMFFQSYETSFEVPERAKMKSIHLPDRVFQKNATGR